MRDQRAIRPAAAEGRPAEPAKRLPAAVTLSVGVVSMALGLLFLLGARGHAQRVVVAVAGLGVGAFLTGVGALLLKRLTGPRHGWQADQARAAGSPAVDEAPRGGAEPNT